MQIVAVAYEARIRPDADDHERVAALGAPEPGMPFSAHADLLSVVDPLRDVDLDLRARHDPPLATAVGACLFHDLAGTAALGAGSLLDELAEDVLRDAADSS